jgi:hypothetical protein
MAGGWLSNVIVPAPITAVGVDVAAVEVIVGVALAPGVADAGLAVAVGETVTGDGVTLDGVSGRVTITTVVAASWRMVRMRVAGSKVQPAWVRLLS